MYADSWDVIVGSPADKGNEEQTGRRLVLAETRVGRGSGIAREAWDNCVPRFDQFARLS